jgi:hypothetical protein
MPIFISYSQKDSQFVDALARNLAGGLFSVHQSFMAMIKST